MSSIITGQAQARWSYWKRFVAVGPEKKASQARPGLTDALMFFLGPFAGLFFVLVIPAVSLLVLLVLIPRIAFGSTGTDEAQMCMGCHSMPGMVKTFKNNEKVSVHLSEEFFKGSVHGFLSCTSCHSDVSMDKHPGKDYSSRRALAASVSKSCRMCHDDSQLFSKTVHQHAIERANAPPCSDCHGIHAIQKVSDWKKKAADSQYCLTCHSKQMAVTMNGETLSLSIEEAAIKQSVHTSHRCQDCHADFSKEAHPIKKFASRRELSVDFAKACGSCHPEKNKLFESSIHSTMLKGGNLSAPVCTDCHSFHNVGPADMAATLKGAPCRRCHEEIFDIYKESVHGLAKGDGSEKAPICSSCHFAHEVEATSAAKSMKSVCIGCHEGAPEAHRKWLPNADAHLDVVACAACHVSDAERSIYLFVEDSLTGKAATEGQLGAKNNTLIEDCAGSGDCIDGKELWDVYRGMKAENSAFVLKGRMALHDGKFTHQMGLKEKAVRKCEKCHSADSDFFKEVKMAVVKEDGTTELYSVSPAALSSAYTMVPLGHFYALGGTRVKLLDYAGILLIISGASFPLVHLTLRGLTRPLRARNKEAKE